MSALSYTEVFLNEAEWRREKARQFPDSPNQDAAAIFDRLAATLKDVPKDLLNAIEEFQGAGNLDDTEMEQDMLRGVGFTFEPKDAEEFLRALMAEMIKGRRGTHLRIA